MNALINKIKIYGEDKLTTEELLSLVFSAKKTQDEKLKIAKKLIKKGRDFTGDLRFIMDITVNELMNLGLNMEDAVRIKAISGIIKRLAYPTSLRKLELNSSTDIANLFMSELRFEKLEKVKIIILNNKNLVLKISTLSKGTSNGAMISVKDILSEPVRLKATRIVLVHNHPSRRFKT